MNLLRKKFILPLFTLLFLFLFSLPVHAEVTTSSSQKIINLAKNQTVDRDYFAAGDEVTMDGTVNGDAFIAGGKVDINGNVNGDLLVAGGQITIRGKVTQNIRAAGGNVLVLGEAGRNVTIVGGNLTIDKSAKIAGNAVMAGGNVDILSQVKDLTLVSGKAKIKNEVLGNVLAGVGMLEVSQDASVRGNLEYWSSNKAMIAEGAKIAGNTTFHLTETPESVKIAPIKAAGFISGMTVIFSLIGLLSSLIFGVILVRLFPLYSEKTADIVIGKFWFSLLTGFITLIVAPVLGLVLILTIIGMPLGLFTLVAYGVIIYLSKIFGAFAVGRLVSDKAKMNLTPVWTFIAGYLVYYIVSLIPFINVIIKTAIILAGTGAIVIQKKHYYLLLRGKKLI